MSAGRISKLCATPASPATPGPHRCERPAHPGDFLDQVVQNQRLESLLAQQFGLQSGPDVEVRVVELLGFRPDLRGDGEYPSNIEIRGPDALSKRWRHLATSRR